MCKRISNNKKCELSTKCHCFRCAMQRNKSSDLCFPIWNNEHEQNELLGKEN